MSRKRSTAVSPARLRSDPCTWHVAAWKACARNDLRPRGCRKPVTAMACGRWLWKARNCRKSHLPKFCGACWARHTMLPGVDLAGGLWPGAVTTPGLSRRLASSVVWRVLSSGACPRLALLLLSHQLGQEASQARSLQLLSTADNTAERPVAGGYEAPGPCNR